MLAHQSVKGFIWKKYGELELSRVDSGQSSYVDLIEKWVNYFGISYFLAQLLAPKIRDTNSMLDVQNFLDPKLKNLMPTPMSFLDTQKGIERLAAAIQRKEKIIIFADYDVDGATSCALLSLFLRQIGYCVEFYIPNRIEHGYGFTVGAFEDCYKIHKPQLIITLDCGTTSCLAISYAKDFLVDVIVIDHHLSPDIPKNAVATINPNRADENTQYTYLAAVGVTFYFLFSFVYAARKTINYSTSKTVNAMHSSNRVTLDCEHELLRRVASVDLMRYLDIVALGTVCDVMQLIGVNRAFVKHGLKQIRNKESGNKGIKALLAQYQEQASVYHLGFIVGPRINAGGRVSDASLGARLLLEEDDEQITSLSKELELANQRRQLIEENYLAEAMEIASQKAMNNNVVFVYGNWHEGVIGIIASRLKDRLEKPVIVGTIIAPPKTNINADHELAASAKNDEIIKASCRSTAYVDLGKIIIEAKNAGILIGGGGHAMAAGLTISASKVKEFEEFLASHSLARNGREMELANREKFYVDELSISSLNSHLILDIEKLEPYGNGNGEPIFLISDLFVTQGRVVGKKHISCILISAHNSKSVRSIAFNAANSEMGRILMNPTNSTISVLANVKMNEWNGRKTWQLVIHDLYC
ncbi:Single-stranded-DNA-specific exonuclease RecJ [Rickettsiales endosymbiont of Paramecium tredecaurelia]|uniref:single-stranded-DNA-specific exonuclease RecJ n=1 Tax=Candidatus Sarmatiella mevalonica TaxID=2770581 RepID=UPI001924F827|nr:single-stranded-DNA-specific exonuclease RecJ [Candidatus Sarmatiella mevalonica]MBL3284780.1 Single-stranded-DNA-specific exonuclease RecJ [Candidatus Sarmatiella mevalonica]